MKITKDEARILAAALREEKYAINHRSITHLFDKLEDLGGRLEQFSEDKRRNGRKSLNDFNDCLKRYAATKKTIIES